MPRFVIEGYGPPPDPRLPVHGPITPDPRRGSRSTSRPPPVSRSRRQQLETLYETGPAGSVCRPSRFDVDGSHRRHPAGGNHQSRSAGSTPADSPLLRRPDLPGVAADLLASGHPVAVLPCFSGRFRRHHVAGRRALTEGRAEGALRGLEGRVCRDRPAGPPAVRPKPWVADRALRPPASPTSPATPHRAEFCIDKLYSPEGPPRPGLGPAGAARVSRMPAAPAAWRWCSRCWCAQLVALVLGRTAARPA